MSEPPLLIVMRLANMRRVHPRQDSSRVCPQCREPVGIYPSGMNALRMVPGLTIVCEQCWSAMPQVPSLTVLAPGAELERWESQPAKKSGGVS